MGTAKTSVGAIRRRLERAVERMPALPEIVQKLVGLDSQTNDYYEQVLRLLEEEPAFAARILSAANSAASAPVHPITTLPMAITRLGPRGAVSRVLAVGVLQTARPGSPLALAAWRHAIQVATFARNLAAQLRNHELVPDEVYAAGLLHDVGRLVLLEEEPELYLELEAEGDECSSDRLAREKAKLGTTHTELGHLACARLRIPESVAVVTRDHHESTEHGAHPKHRKLVDLVGFSDWLVLPSTAPGSAGYTDLDADAFSSLVGVHVPSFLGLGPKVIFDLMTLSIAEAEIFAEEMGLSPGLAEAEPAPSVS